MGTFSASHDPRPRADSSGVLVRRLARSYILRHWPPLTFAFLCMAILAASNAATAWLMQPVIDDVFVSKDSATLYLVAGAILALSALKGASNYGQSVIVENTGQRMVADLQGDMYARLVRADLATFHDQPVGVLLSRFTNDANLLRNAMTRSMTSMCKDALMLVFLVGLMFYQDWTLAIAAFFVFPVAVYPILRIGRRMRKISYNTQAEIGGLATALEETFQGVRVVKAYGMEAQETGRTRDILDGVFRQFRRAARVRFATAPIMETLGGIAAAGIISYGGWRVISGAITAGEFFSFLTALLLAYQPLKAMANANAYVQEGLAAVQRVFAILDITPTIVDRPDARPLEVRDGAIRFSGVHFSYGGAAAALNGVDLDIPAGATVALVGASGAGKTTLLNLLPRFYDPDAGSVAIDGQDLRDVTLDSLRAKIALVSQETGLFDDSVRANIAYGRPGATEAEIVAAAKAAAAHDFITQLAQGYDTRVGGGGMALSGGQRQRISIARAMLKDSPILLLDEATSALDTESERQVQAALARLKQGRTTLVIAHRLSTVVDADLICVLDGGRVIERGTHGELIARGGAYARLYALQFAGAEDGVVEAVGA